MGNQLNVTLTREEHDKQRVVCLHRRKRFGLQQAKHPGSPLSDKDEKAVKERCIFDLVRIGKLPFTLQMTPGQYSWIIDDDAIDKFDKLLADSTPLPTHVACERGLMPISSCKSDRYKITDDMIHCSTCDARFHRGCGVADAEENHAFVCAFCLYNSCGDHLVSDEDSE